MKMADKIDALFEQLARIEDKLDYIMCVIQDSMGEEDYDDADMDSAFGKQRNGTEVL